MVQTSETVPTVHAILLFRSHDQLLNPTDSKFTSATFLLLPTKCRTAKRTEMLSHESFIFTGEKQYSMMFWYSCIFFNSTDGHKDAAQYTRQALFLIFLSPFHHHGIYICSARHLLGCFSIVLYNNDRFRLGVNIGSPKERRAGRKVILNRRSINGQSPSQITTRSSFLLPSLFNISRAN